MPRIAAALGVLATVAFCIGFNLQHYPVVWQSMATAPNPLVGAMQSAVVSPPPGAIAGAIRPATGKTTAEAKGLPQPIPLPQVAGFAQPIPRPASARHLPADELTSDYEPVAALAEKYAGPAEPPKPSVTEKPKTKPTPRTASADSKKSKSADPKKSKPVAAAKTKSPDKPKPLAADKPKPRPEKSDLQAQKAKPSPADKPKTQTAKAETTKAQPVVAAKPKPQEPVDEIAPITRVVERPLVPVRPSEGAATSQPSRGWNTSRSPWSTPATPDRSVRRLPPVDPTQVSVNPFGPPAGPLPFYPTTGM